MKKYFTLTLFILALLSSSASAFSDVPPHFYQYKAITWLGGFRDVKGYSDGTFKPNKPINRAEFLKILYQMIPMNESTSTLPFRDVPLSAWFAPYVKEAYAAGLIGGYSDGTFKPERQITLAEALKILITAFPSITFGSDLSGWRAVICGNSSVWNSEKYIASQGVDINAWYWRYISAAGKACILTNDYSPIEMSTIQPARVITRGDVAVMLYKIKHRSYSFSYGKNLFDLPPTVTETDKIRMNALESIGTVMQIFRFEFNKYPENGEDNKIPLELASFFQGGTIPRDPDGTSYFYHKDATNPDCFILGAQMDTAFDGNSKDNVVQSIASHHCSELGPILVDGLGTGFYMIYSWE